MNVTTRQETPFTLVLERDIPAPRLAVWRCWTEPTLFKQWYCPKPWEVPESEMDLRPGGRMNTVMKGPDGTRMEVNGIFLEVIPQVRLTFTDAYTEGFIPAATSFMTGFVELSDAKNGGTKMIWGARHAKEEDLKAHLEMGFEQGWTAASDQLADLAQSL